jgi:hypothetical protein
MPFTCSSASSLLTFFLESPYGKSALISTYLPDEDYYHHPCAGDWFKQFVQECPSTKIPLALTLFFDHYEGTQNTSYGVYLLGILNLRSEALLSPTSKMCLAVVPPQLDLPQVQEFILEELKELQEYGLFLCNHEGVSTEYYVRIAFAAGDSHDLNNFIGIGSFGSTYGCRSCWVNRKNIQNYTKKFPEKNYDEIRKLYLDISELANNGDLSGAKKLQKEYSLLSPPISSFILLSGNWCKWSPRDILHAELLGLLKKELNNIFKYHLSSSQVEKLVQILSNFKFPRNEQHVVNKINKVSCFNGREIKNMISILPYGLFQIISHDEPWLECFIKHCHYYQLLSQTAIKKTNRLIMEKQISDHHILYKSLYPSKAEKFFSSFITSNFRRF